MYQPIHSGMGHQKYIYLLASRSAARVCQKRTRIISVKMFRNGIREIDVDEFMQKVPQTTSVRAQSVE